MRREDLWPTFLINRNDLAVSSASVGALGIYNFVFLQKWIAGLGWGIEVA